MNLSLPIPRKINFEFYYDHLGFFDNDGNRLKIMDLTQDLSKEDNVQTLYDIIKKSIPGTEDERFLTHATLGGKIKATYQKKTSVADMDHEKMYIVCQEIKKSQPDSFHLEFRFYSAHGSAKRPEIRLETKIFPKKIEVTMEKTLFELKKEIFDMIKPALKV